MILAIDVGGTKVEMRAFRSDGSKLGVTPEPFSVDGAAVFALRFDAANKDFLAMVDHASAALRDPVRVIGLAVAGPIDPGNMLIKPTNLSWPIDVMQLQARTVDGRSVLVLNDLEALALGATMLERDEGIILQAGAGRVGNRCVIAAGTGLGQALLIWDGRSHRAVPTEGGHTDFGAQSKEDIEILRLAIEQYGSHVSWERVVSGAFGIPLLLRYFSKDGGLLSDAWQTPGFDADYDWGHKVATMAESGDPIANRVLRKFCWLYGAEAGNLALKCLAVGGVYVGGGIAPKILPWMRAGEFLAGFKSKGRFTGLMETIPVMILLEVGLALRGVAKAARDRFA